MELIFRCDADARIGSGHVRRCLTLAEALRDAGARCHFLVRAAPGDLRDAILDAGHRLSTLDPGALAAPTVDANVGVDPYASWLPWNWGDDVAMCQQQLRGARADWVVVDQYALDARWESAMRGSAARILAIDDLANRRHDCDLLLDANFGRGADDYAALVPAGTQMLLGSRHVLLRPEFERVRGASPRPSRQAMPRRLLVNMGGSDPVNASGQALHVLQAVEGTQSLHATVVLGRDAPFTAQVQAAVERSRVPATLLVDPPDMAALMAAADLAIGSGGTGVYERLYMRLPSLVTPVADNQRAHLTAMAAAGLFRLYEGEAELRAALCEVLSQGASLPRDVVGNGVPTVCRAMAAQGLLLLRPDARDVRRTYRWLQDEGLRADFLMRQRPERRQHVAYWRDLLANPDEHVFAIHADGRHVGNAGLRNLRPAHDEAELWLYLGDATQRGRGLGARTLAALESFMRTRLGVARADLHVDQSNRAACALYASAGYRVVPRLPEGPAFGPGVVRMEKAL